MISEIIFIFMKFLDFDKKDVKIVNFLLVFLCLVGENFIYSCIMFFFLMLWVKNIIFVKESGCLCSMLDNIFVIFCCD